MNKLFLCKLYGIFDSEFCLSQVKSARELGKGEGFRGYPKIPEEHSESMINMTKITYY